MAEEKPKPAPSFSYEGKFEFKVEFHPQTGLSITAPNTDMENLIYCFKMFQIISNTEEMSKHKATKKQFTQHDKNSITQTRYILKKILDQVFTKVLRNIKPPELQSEVKP